MSEKQELTARTADKYELYQRSVQTAETDAKFLARRFFQLAKRPLRILREDFCGTAQLLCEFVKLHQENFGIGVELDAQPVRWSYRHNLALLTDSQRQRIRILQQNVRNVKAPPVDLITAFNFSYAIFKTRQELREYFRTVHAALKKDGVFMIDIAGGKEVPEVGREAWTVDGFQYVWDVSRFDPISHHLLCKIHFLFRDGSRINNAFTYDWRLWTLPELQELFTEAGFQSSHTLWEDTDRKTNLGNGVMRRVKEGYYQGAWYAILVGQK